MVAKWYWHIAFVDRDNTGGLKATAAVDNVNFQVPDVLQDFVRAGDILAVRVNTDGPEPIACWGGRIGLVVFLERPDYIKEIIRESKPKD